MIVMVGKMPTSDQSGQTSSRKRRAYKKPTLRVYGQVRDLTGGNGSSVNGDGGPLMKAASDRRLKSNVVRIGDHSLGIGLYLFDYTNDCHFPQGLGRQFGVMADEVALVLPAAVSVGPDGYQRVDYNMLGISRPPR
jgi:hypothetical protein